MKIEINTKKMSVINNKFFATFAVSTGETSSELLAEWDSSDDAPSFFYPPFLKDEEARQELLETVDYEMRWVLETSERSGMSIKDAIKKIMG